jgi:zinc protease
MMLRTVSLLCLFAITGLPRLLGAADPIPLPQEGSDIPADPAVKWGVLENGLRYAILPNAEPPNRVSMRLFVDAGSLMENDDQQGLAHFLEHMAFNGTKNFPAGEMVEYFQRLGMGFGNHTNAHTSFNETVYKLELPNSDAVMIDEGMKLFRDYADGMLLLPDEIDEERGIILSEKRDRDSVSWRTFVEQIKFAFPDQRVSRRMPIGTEDVISGAPRERFVEFYENWYTPNRMAVVVVGDVEVAAIEKLVTTHFASMATREKRPSPAMGEMSKRGFATHYHHEAEAGETSVSIEVFKPRVDPPDNSERRLFDLNLMLAGQMVDRRLERIAKAEDSPISSASMRAGDFYDLGFAVYSSIDADCKPGNWKEALAVIEQELRRAVEHGFTAAELAEARANLLRMYEDAAKQMGTRQSRQLADQISERLGSRRIFTNPADDLPRVTAALEAITEESCREHLADLWESANETLVLVSGNAVIEEPLAAIKTAFESSKAIAVTAPEEKAVAEFAYGKLPEPGKVAERTEVEDLAVTQLRFENNVRVNLKVTDFEDETVYVKARIGSGLLTEKVPGLSFLLGSTFTKGGLQAHSDDDLQAIFAGKSIGVSFSVDDDAFTLSGQTTPDTLAEQLTLMRAYVTNPGFREEAVTEFKRALDYLYQQLERTPGGFAQDEVAQFLHSGDARFGYPPRDAVEALTGQQAKDWVMPELASGYFEVTIVGSFDKEAAITQLAATFGNLDERAAAKPDHTAERLVKFPAGTTKEFLFESEIPKAMAVVHWPTIDIFEIEKTRRLGMLSAIIDDRLRVKIREELGDAYSPFAHNLPSDTWTDYGYLFASVTIDPAQAGSVTEVVTGIAKDLATGNSITEDELERAKKPQVTSIEEMRRTNRYWMSSVLESSQEYPERLGWSRTFVDDYQDITVDEVNALAAEFLKTEKQVNVIIKPNPAAAPASEAPAAAPAE